MEIARYLFKFYYIGTKKFYGSQRQPNKLTIEDCLIETLLKGKYVNKLEDSGFEVASRTDRFVSARGATFSVKINKKPILMELNSLLPKEIGLWAYTKVPLNFLSRFNAEYRHYKYFMPIDKNLNLKLIKKACKELEGRHDFKNFSKRENEEINTIRDMISVDLEIRNDHIIFDFKSKAFLRQQIRRIVAKLIELGKGKITYDEFRNLFDTNDYKSYQPADPIGLILWDIFYGKDIEFIYDNKSLVRMKNVFIKLEQDSNQKRLLFKILQRNNVS
ncbi:MAG: tRNA pseudouridine(38-40) synthase TruA [Candidatus Thorarchaeota archaeon]